MMAEKNHTEVLIDGKVYHLAGVEGEEYLHKVATYINNRLEEFNQVENFRKQSGENRNLMVLLNIADDYFKAKKQSDLLSEEMEAKDKEMYDLKHEMIAAQVQLENMEKAMKEMQTKTYDLQKQIVKLETELDGRKR
ncbi:MULTISPECIES: cell division protein ZapA [Diplocloster]|uniref:Cell division protein ZapA n=1 Tax=Diplocloster modestus TaxID=2850322 RepID=A0ABS6KCC7_9FIRM|nr:cell division protein ZapA [Diplocloster modestus]